MCCVAGIIPKYSPKLLYRRENMVMTINIPTWVKKVWIKTTKMTLLTKL